MGLVDVTIDGGIQVIRLNRPERKNAINVEVKYFTYFFKLHALETFIAQIIFIIHSSL